MWGQESLYKAQRLIAGATASVVTDLPCHRRRPGRQNLLLNRALLSPGNPQQLSPVHILTPFWTTHHADVKMPEHLED